MDEPHSIALDIYGSITVSVALLDANHCPGSVFTPFVHE